MTFVLTDKPGRSVTACRVESCVGRVLSWDMMRKFSCDWLRCEFDVRRLATGFNCSQVSQVAHGVRLVEQTLRTKTKREMPARRHHRYRSVFATSVARQCETPYAKAVADNDYFATFSLSIQSLVFVLTFAASAVRRCFPTI